ncbi:MAG: acetyltransferase [Lachnospiraceae bacterium]|nr:acetyltransferase [Lachnospiraceae bacterium]
MKQKKLIVFGADDFAQIVKFYFDADSEYEVCGFCVDKEYRKSDSFCDLPLVSSENVEEVFPPDSYEMFIAIAYTHLNAVREEKYHEFKKRGYKLATYISSKATCWHEDNAFGDNVFILEDNTIQPYAHIGSDTILWSGNHVGHHAVIGDHVFITSHVVLSGRTSVGNNSFIGINASVHDHVKIAERNVIGSGALITRDTVPDSIYRTKWTEASEKSVGESRYFFHDAADGKKGERHV